MFSLTASPTPTPMSPFAMIGPSGTCVHVMQGCGGSSAYVLISECVGSSAALNAKQAALHRPVDGVS
jgi:hypothetical protein